MLTQSQLREILTYNPVTGLWFNKKNKEVGCHDHGYVRILINGKKYYAHRLAWLYMTGEWPPVIIDHKNLIGTKNDWDNLRLATKSTNGANLKITKRNKTGLKGVSICRNTGKYRADITVQEKGLNLGRFDCPAAAHFAYQIAAEKAFGAYSRVA